MRASLLLLIALALVGTGCSGVRGTLVESGVADTTTETLPEAWEPEEVLESNSDGTVAIGDRASAEPFAFTAPELFTGSSVSGLELYDDAPMIVSFVSPSCPICVTEGPEIAFAADMHPDITYLVVHSGADTESYRSFAEEAGLYQELSLIHI